MHKYIQRLVESLFDDDFDDIYQPGEDVDDIIKEKYTIKSFAECSDLNDINFYLTESFQLDTILIDLIFDIIVYMKNKKSNFALSDLDNVIKKYKDKGQIIADRTGWYSDKNEYQITIPIFERKGLSFKIKEGYKLFNDIIYRAQPVFSYYLSMSDMNDENEIMLCLNPLYNEVRGVGIKKYSIHVKNAENQKLINLKEDYSEKLQENLDDKLRNFIYNYLTNNLHTDRVLDELTREGKDYEVKQKDYDRMVKCLRTENFSGFDKITKPDKMIARVAAFFIAAKNLGYKQYEFKLDDEAIFNYMFNNAADRTSYTPYSYRSRYSSSYKKHKYEYTVQMLLKIKQFPTLHLKDVIATYNAYKDKF